MGIPADGEGAGRKGESSLEDRGQGGYGTGLQSKYPGATGMSGNPISAS